MKRSAYEFLHRLGHEELNSNDPDSWACRGARGVQVLFWNFTPPTTNESDQKFFKRDLPAKDFGSVRVSIAGLPPGNYQLNVYRIGYQVNDVYADYLKLGSPQTLRREQVRALAAKNDGGAVETAGIRVNAGRTFTRDVLLRENDVYLIMLERSAKT